MKCWRIGNEFHNQVSSLYRLQCTPSAPSADYAPFTFGDDRSRVGHRCWLSSFYRQDGDARSSRTHGSDDNLHCFAGNNHICALTGEGAPREREAGGRPTEALENFTTSDGFGHVMKYGIITSDIGR